MQWKGILMSSSEPTRREFTPAIGDVQLPSLPPLRAGDHLDQPTFHARYEAMPPDFRAELIDGVVIVSSPTSPKHGRPHAIVIGWLTVFDAATPGAVALDNVSSVLGARSEPQPDAALLIEAECGGQARIEEKWVVGAAELLAEVAYSSEAYDLHSKRGDYERAGVREYIVVLLRERRVIWFVLRNQQFEELRPDVDGILRSTVFPGLWLDPAALLANDMAKVLDALRQGIATPEHAAFVNHLAAERARLGGGR
jgi:Uma2 family endonuclease